MSKVSNILLMIEYMSTGRKYSVKELADILEVSTRMIRVYKEDLEKAGIYLDTIKGPYGGYVLNQKVSMPKRFIERENIEIKNKDIYNILAKAIKNKSKCYIEYYTKSNEITKRDIYPYELFLLNNKWGVAAFCNLRNEVRHFYLDRIKLININK